jgi:hypothetical protein
MNYRFVHLNSHGGAASGEDWDCASDVEAIERAQRETPSFGAEIWRGDHRLGIMAGPMSADRDGGSSKGHRKH